MRKKLRARLTVAQDVTIPIGPAMPGIQELRLNPHPLLVYSPLADSVVYPVLTTLHHSTAVTTKRDDRPQESGSVGLLAHPPLQVRLYHPRPRPTDNSSHGSAVPADAV